MRWSSRRKYGNKPQDTYVEWFLPFAKEIRRVLKKDGSFVVNVAGAWQKGHPVRSPYHFTLLIELIETVKFHLAQEVYWYNPAKNPSRSAMGVQLRTIAALMACCAASMPTEPRSPI